MTKAALIAQVAEQTGQTQVATGKFLDAFTQVVKESVQNDEQISLAGFGTFLKIERKERMGINPSTKEPLLIAAKSAAKFRPSPHFLN